MLLILYDHSDPITFYLSRPEYKRLVSFNLYDCTLLAIQHDSFRVLNAFAKLAARQENLQVLKLIHEHGQHVSDSVDHFSIFKYALKYKKTSILLFYAQHYMNELIQQDVFYLVVNQDKIKDQVMELFDRNRNEWTQLAIKAQSKNSIKSIFYWSATHAKMDTLLILYTKGFQFCKEYNDVLDYVVSNPHGTMESKLHVLNFFRRYRSSVSFWSYQRFQVCILFEFINILYK